MNRNSSLMLVVICTGLLLSAVPSTGQAAEPVPWKLDFEIKGLGSVVVRTPLDRADTVWYIRFAVTNNTEGELPLALHFALTTDTKKTYVETVHPAAEKILERRAGMKLLNSKERPDSIGAGESIAGVAFVGSLDPNFDRLQATVTGLRDVVYRVGTRRFFEKIGLVFEWARPGDEYFTRRDPVKLVKKHWKTLEGPREIR